jgi:hypothetical protein
MRYGGCHVNMSATPHLKRKLWETAVSNSPDNFIIISVSDAWQGGSCPIHYTWHAMSVCSTLLCTYHPPFWMSSWLSVCVCMCTNLSIYLVGFQVLMAASMNMAVFWVVAPCSLVDVYRRFRGASCLHHQGDDGSSKYLWNVGKLLSDYTALQPRIQSSSYPFIRPSTYISIYPHACMHTYTHTHIHIRVFVHLCICNFYLKHLPIFCKFIFQEQMKKIIS